MRSRLLLGATALFLGPGLGALEVPYLSARVNDLAGILSPQAAQELEALLKAHEGKTSNQIAVLTLPSLDGESLEGYSVRVAKTWKLGQKGKDNGILLLVARDDRKMRIEVGYGLEATLPDALCGRIIRDEMVPAFREKDFDRGVSAGVKAIVGTLDGSYTPPPEGRGEAGSAGGLPVLPDWRLRIMMGFFVFGIIGLFTVIGLLTPGFMGWFLYLFLIPFWASFPMVILGMDLALKLLAAYLIGYPLLRLYLPRTELGKSLAKGLASGRGRGGGYSSGSSGGSSGGFSGGGGSFGGGGASGGW